MAQAMQKTVLPMGMMGQIPWAILQKNMLPETDTFGVIGATVADNFEVKMPEGTIGTSILEQFK